ncbi:hypothetical protein [Chlorobium sp. N1]|uniref:hypothetical protein n=1 Tax=Chlorobium sp. N1 TaxID=2491138 RepID=UPI00103C9792|nr:hypothetical protein [Chlorobium sp. N1]TCD46989.1 hypothetical protein E0L29_10150 [Chlorobium sp. N1]
MMNYQDKVVCFLDILGFKKHVNDTIVRGGEEDLERTDHLIKVFNLIREILDIDQSEERFGTEVTQFSDCVVISFNITEESGVFYALLDIMWVQVNLALNGILCRGGVAQGKLVHTPKVLFGPGMVNAYELESKAAVYPRVIFGESIIQLGIQAHGAQNRPDQEANSIMNLLKKDFDGMYYVDYITGAQQELDAPEFDYPEYLSKLQKIVAEGLTLKDPSIRIKYQWLKEKLQPHINGIKSYVALELPEGSDLREAYESIPDL